LLTDAWLCNGVASLPLLEPKEDLFVLTLWALDGGTSMVILFASKQSETSQTTKYVPPNVPPLRDKN